MAATERANAIRGLSMLFGVAALAAACAHEGATAARPTAGRRADDDHAQVVVGPAAMTGGERTLAAWLAYGVAKAGTYDKHPRPAANDSGDDFDLELAARQAQSAFLADPQSGAGPANRALDRQVEIFRAGFLPELVVAIHAHPGWTIPPATITALRLPEFAKRFAGDYETTAAVAIDPPSGKRWADVPGADFPDPARLPYGPESCGRALDERRAAWRRWDALVPRLGGAPLSATSAQDFAGELVAAQRDPERARLGATWVSDRVYALAALEGFCGVEEKDWPRAREFLMRAIALRPSAGQPRLELSMALINAGRVQDALAEADKVLATSENPCMVALAWRRRGYILVDLGDLPSARDAYQKSLVIEPTSDIAKKELAFIEDALKAPAKTHPKGFVPPPPAAMSVTSCTPPR
jgi:tetratricopeptide (TPR) repeat protein